MECACDPNRRGRRINKDYLWLKGAAAAYLERFPEAPAELAR